MQTSQNIRKNWQTTGLTLEGEEHSGRHHIRRWHERNVLFCGIWPRLDGQTFRNMQRGHETIWQATWKFQESTEAKRRMKLDAVQARGRRHDRHGSLIEDED